MTRNDLTATARTQEGGLQTARDLLDRGPLQDEYRLSQETYSRLSASSPDGSLLKRAAVQTAPKLEILWYDTTNGATTSWIIEGTTQIDDRLLNPSLPITDLNWSIVGTGDFSGDGQDDILWRNRVSGQNAWWVMSGNRIQSVSFLTPVADLNWQIVGTGDYNRDGQVDLLWRNTANGNNGWWLMNGAEIASIASLPAEPTLTKKIVGVGDYNRDGQLDLLWRDSATGDNRWWVMNGNIVVDQPVLTPVTPGRKLANHRCTRLQWRWAK
ncbi:MAG: VCBS repeat-containing protein [Leptolyngbyaceae cyanobacterium CSU_1_3]|nr:VCBS repeat-containing protein [Leptolyngbyaceae cyanobacterium CSU_1_3]